MANHRITFDESGFYNETVTITDNRCSPQYLRHVLELGDQPEAGARECVDWQVVCRGLPRKRARREFHRNLALQARQTRRLWLLVRRKEAV